MGGETRDNSRAETSDDPDPKQAATAGDVIRTGYQPLEPLEPASHVRGQLQHNSCNMKTARSRESRENKASPTLSHPVTRPIQIPDHTTVSNPSHLLITDSAPAFPCWSRSSPRQFYFGFRSNISSLPDYEYRWRIPLGPAVAMCPRPLAPVSSRSLPFSLDNSLNSSLISYCKFVIHIFVSGSPP